MPDASYDVFISYKSEDLELAEEATRRLVAEGFGVWFDKARLNPACKWHEEIEAGCEASRIILPILTPRWQESEWTRFETYGHDCVLGLWCEGEDIAAITPPPLRGVQHLDFRAPTEGDWQKLFASLRCLLDESVPEKAARVAHLPYAHNPYFVGREKLLLEIHEKLDRGPTVALTHAPAFVVAGMGGVGKTTLAREYAEKFWRLYRQILWVSAAQTTSLTTEFARLALEMGLLMQPTEDAAADAGLALRALAGDDARLLIIDNAEDEEAVQAWVPQTSGCRTIITSRFTSWSPAVECVPVHVLDPVPARELLLRGGRLPDTPETQTAADRLADTLGYLPLALEQAAAFIRETRVSLEAYLELYGQSHGELLAQGALGSTQYPDSVATTWLLTVGKLSPLAQAILRLSTFLASEGIPRDLLDSAGEVLPEAVAEIAGGEAAVIAPLSLVTALGELSRYSMIELDETAFGVHRLVQEVERDRLDPDIRKRWAEWAVATVNEAFPYVEFSNWPRCAQLVPHAMACAQHIQHEAIVSEQAGRLLNQAGYYLDKRANYAGAEPLYHQALEVRRRALGEDHPDFAASLNNLALLRQAQARYPAAEALFRRAVEVLRKALGEEHPDFATSLNNLAMVCTAQGNYSDAEPLLKQALDVRRRTLGEDHPDFAGSLNNLAGLYYRQRRYAAAEPLYEQALEISRRTLGEEHPDFATSLYNLAHLYCDKGEFAEADPLFQQAVEIWRRALGENHPHFASVLNSLAAVYYAQGNYAAAEPLVRQAIEIHRNALGEDHPNFATSLDNLALLYHTQGNHVGAEALYMQALAIRRRVLGEDHLELTTDLNNLAALYFAQGTYAAADPLYREALDIRRRNLGNQHPDTRTAMRNLAVICDALGKHEEAAALRREADEESPDDGGA